MSKKKKPNFLNTCGFDALMALLCSVEADKIEKKDEFKEELMYLINILNTVGYTSHNGTAQLYKDKILAKIMKVPNNCYNIVDCQNNITFFVESVGIVSYTIGFSTKCECTKDIPNKSVSFIYLNIQNEAELLINLLKIDEVVQLKKKKKCLNGHSVETKYTFQDIIYIQLTFFTDVNKIKLCQIPENIPLNGENYKLKGIINFKAPQIDKGIGHYQCYAYRAGKVCQNYDNSSKTILKTDKFIIPHLVTYVKDSKFN